MEERAGILRLVSSSYSCDQISGGVKILYKVKVEFRFFEPPREMEIGSKNQEFEKSKVTSYQTCFTVVWFYKVQEGRQQRYITFFNVNHLYLPTKQNENLRI